MIKLAVVTTHPIQYNAPIFQMLSARKKISIKVFYTWGNGVLENKFDPGFGRIIEWDIPLLEGYEYAFVTNTSRLPSSGNYRGIDNPSLINEIKSYNPDALLVFGWNFKSHLKLLRFFHNKIPILFRGDSTLINNNSWVRNLARTFFLKWVFKNIDFALYVGVHNKNYFKHHGLKENQLILAKHATDNDRFTSLEAEFSHKAKDWKNALGIKQHEITVLYAGKLETVKNPFFITELAASLQKSHVKFIIVGNGPLESEIKKRAVNNNQVIFIDFQNQLLMPVVYRLGDIFILPSKSETWGLSVNEAMACGCAIAVSDKVGCAIDLTIESKNGIVFGLNEVGKCRDFILELSNNQDKLLNMKLNSRKLIKDYNFANIVVQIENLLLTIGNH